MIRALQSHKPIQADLGILILRLFTGLTMLGAHGWGKLQRALSGDFGFADVLGMGETTSLVLVIFAEVLCAFLVAIGLFTRLALIPLIITMLLAVFIIHADDPFSKQEFGLLYLVPYAALLLIGPGKYSLDAQLSKR